MNKTASRITGAKTAQEFKLTVNQRQAERHAEITKRRAEQAKRTLKAAKKAFKLARKFARKAAKKARRRAEELSDWLKQNRVAQSKPKPKARRKVTSRTKPAAARKRSRRKSVPAPPTLSSTPTAVPAVVPVPL